MPQFNEDANLNTLSGLSNAQPTYQQPQQYAPNNPGAQEDYELISLLNPNANRPNTGTDTGNVDTNALSKQVNDLGAVLQQSLDLQRQTQQQDLEARLRQQQDEQRRLLEQQQKDALITQQQQREQLLKGLMPTIDEDRIALTPEEEKAFGVSTNFVRKVATKAQQDILNQMAPGMRTLVENQMKLEQTIAELKANNQNVGMNAQQQQDLIIQAQVPDAATLVRDPRFAQFKQMPSASPGFTNGDLIDMAYSNGRTMAVIGHLNAFRDMLAGKPPSINMQGGQGIQPIQQHQRVQKLRRSEYDQATQQYQMGLMDQATFDKIDAQFQQALVEGRVADL